MALVTPPDDWAVVEEALNESCSDWQLHNKYLAERPDWYENGHAALARLREREEQLEQTLLEVAEKGYERVLQGRYEAAEAEVERLRAELEADWNRGAELDQARLAQIARLEAALRDIATMGWSKRTVVMYDGEPHAIARRALAHEEEKEEA